MKQTKRITFCAMMSALGVVSLFLGSIIDVFDLTATILASLFVFVTAEELGILRGFAVWFVTATIGFLLLPSKIVAIEYILFAVYPILRKLLGKLPKILSFILKGIYIIASGMSCMLISKFVFFSEEPLYMEVITAVGFILILALCEVLYRRFALYYSTVLRKRLRIDKFFSEK